jgi:hypothetical protein
MVCILNDMVRTIRLELFSNISCYNYFSTVIERLLFKNWKYNIR